MSNSHINIKLNGVAKNILVGQTLQKLVNELDLKNKRYAVEVNTQIIPKSKFNDKLLQKNDVVEIVHAIGGG